MSLPAFNTNEELAAKAAAMEVEGVGFYKKDGIHAKPNERHKIYYVRIHFIDGTVMHVKHSRHFGSQVFKLRQRKSHDN